MSRAPSSSVFRASVVAALASRGAPELIYDVPLDPDDPDDVRAIAVGLIGSNKRVLEFGCATGRVSKALKDRGCTVVGVEQDSEMASVAEKVVDHLVQIDLDVSSLDIELGGETFEAALFGDVLEHLRDPLSVLRATRRLLEPHGVLVVSVPNVGHVDLRLALLRGEFEYRSWGLLDRTHLRLFTLSSLESMLDDAGFAAIEVRRRRVRAFESEITLDQSAYEPELVAEILRDPEADVYQYVVLAVPDNGDARVRQLARRCRSIEAALTATRVEYDAAVAEAGEQSRVAADALPAAESAELQTAIRSLIINWNDDPKPFVWHKTADEILA